MPIIIKSSGYPRYAYNTNPTASQKIASMQASRFILSPTSFFAQKNSGPLMADLHAFPRPGLIELHDFRDLLELDRLSEGHALSQTDESAM
jgi:hypothetical protein